LLKINAFKQYCVRTTHDDIVDCGKGVRTQEIKIGSLPLWSFHSRSIFSTKYWNNKVFFRKTALFKNKI